MDTRDHQATALGKLAMDGETVRGSTMVRLASVAQPLRDTVLREVVPQRYRRGRCHQTSRFT
jgi:hypothetical protein